MRKQGGTVLLLIGLLFLAVCGGTAAGQNIPAHATGIITKFPLPTPRSDPLGISAGLDGNLWFTENGGNKIGQITTGR